jgi:hypothetical protein
MSKNYMNAFPIPSTIEGFNRSLAFLVAIDRYENGVPELKTPVADAKKLAEVLRHDHGFEAQVIANEHATQRGLRVFLEGLKAQVTADDRVIFYFAGHGTALESDDGPKGYILPQDAGRNSDEKYLSMVELDEALSTLQCRHLLVILDCCFAGAFRWANFRHLILAPEKLHQERYAWFVSDPAWQAIASAAHDQKALDVAAGEALGKRDDAQNHSPFARALINGLTGAADRASVGGSGDGVITATELYLHIDEALRPSANSRRVWQTPILWPLKKHDKGQFVFLVPGKKLNLPKAPPLDPDANPWRGLEAYDEKHKDLFYGRSAASDRLADRLLGREASEGQAALSAERFIVVIGPSGIGKSSLIRAGLLLRVRHRLTPIIVRPSRPGPTPFASLVAALKAVSPSDRAVPDEHTLKANPKALTEWVKAQGGDRELLLVIDQAEELITMSNKEDIAEGFIELIANALDHTDNGLRVVFTVRSEFEPQFAQSPLKDRWPAARYLVPRMTQDELHRVIEGPAAVKVMRFESAELVDKLVNDVVQMPGALPLLSFALSQMYRHYLTRRGTDRVLTQADYDALEGGVAGSLRMRANQVVDGIDELHQQTARRVLERFVSVEAGEFVRRRVPRSEFDVSDPAEQARAENILKRLDEERLTISDDFHLELAHDALILGWDRLHTWVRQDAPLITDLRRLTTDAGEWDAPGRIRSAPVWDDPAQIATIKRLQETPFPGLNRIENRFVEASIQRARRNRIVRRSAIALLFLLTIGAIGAAMIARIQRQTAIRNEQIAVSRQLAAQSRSAQDEQLDLSLLLAIAADQIVETREATNALLAALTKGPPVSRYLRLHHGPVIMADELKSGKGFVTGDMLGYIRIWDLSGSELGHLDLPNGSAAWSFAQISSETIAIGDSAGTVHIVSLKDFSIVDTIPSLSLSKGAAHVVWRKAPAEIIVGYSEFAPGKGGVFRWSQDSKELSSNKSIIF